MTKDEVLSYFGNASKVSRALGLTHAAVLAWREVPHQWQFQLERMTGGELVADCPLPPYALGIAARDLPEGRWPRTPAVETEHEPD